MSTAATIGDVLVVVTALIAFADVVGYHLMSGGAWRRSHMGQHIMAFMSVISLILFVGMVRIVTADVFHHPDTAWFLWLRVATFSLMPLVLAWRFLVIIGVGDDASPRPRKNKK